MKRITFEPGCYVDHSLRTVEETSRAIVELAQGAGFTYDPGTTEERADPEYWDWVETEAIQWLNDHACPEGYYWDHDGDAGAFGLWECEEQ